MLKISSTTCYSTKSLLFLTRFFVGFGLVSASICGRRGEAILGKCDLPSLPPNLVLPSYSILPNLETKPSEIFSGLNFNKVDNCAVVGLSEGLLKCSKGKDIDSASVVFRMGFSPLRKFKDHVGTKVNVTLCRVKSCGNMNYRFIRDLYGFKWSLEYEAATILLKDIQKSKFGFWNTSGISDTFLGEYSRDGVKISPSTGFQLSIDLLASQKCKSIHIYGLGNGLRRYHHDLKISRRGAEERKAARLRKQNMKRSHSQDIERDIIKRLQRGGYKIYKHDCIN